MLDKGSQDEKLKNKLFFIEKKDDFKGVF